MAWRKADARRRDTLDEAIAVLAGARLLLFTMSPRIAYLSKGAPGRYHELIGGLLDDVQNLIEEIERGQEAIADEIEQLYKEVCG